MVGAPASFRRPMQPEIHIGPLDLKTFGIMFALGFLAAGACRAALQGARQAGRLGLRDGVRRARRRPRGPAAHYLIQNWDEVKDDLFGNLFSGSGLVWYGGAARRRARRAPVGAVARLARLALLDLAAVPLRSATRSGGSAASSPATATTASRPTCRGRCPIRTAPCRRPTRCIRRPSTSRSRWGSSRWLLWRLRDRFAPGILFALYLVLAGSSASWWSSSGATRTVVAGLTEPQLIERGDDGARRGDAGRAPAAAEGGGGGAGSLGGGVRLCVDRGGFVR